MTTLYARLNIGLKPGIDRATVARSYEAVLHDAAIDGYADDFEVFYLESSGIVGVAVPFKDDESWSLLEAGQVLGYVQRCVEESDLDGAETFYASIVTADGTSVSSLM